MKRKRQKQAGLKEKKVKQKTEKNTAVYVSGIPKDATVEEVAEVFKKGGVFLIDPLTSLPRIKLYRNEMNHLKGDALIIYLREESVQLACQLLDDTPLRFDDTENLRVQPAVFKEKPKVEEEEDMDMTDKKIKARAIQKVNK